MLPLRKSSKKVTKQNEKGVENKRNPEVESVVKDIKFFYTIHTNSS